MSQLDMFAPVVEAPPDADSDERFPPSPLDGLVHALKEVRVERGTRYITVRCGAEMPRYRSQDRLAGATGWHSATTCPKCRGEA